MGYFITVEQKVNIFIENINPEQGKPILFLHGWAVTHKMFEYQFNHFPKLSYRCIGLNFRGFGKQDRPWQGYSYNRIPDDIRIVIDTLRLEGVILVAHSMGGAIAIRYMAHMEDIKLLNQPFSEQRPFLSPSGKDTLMEKHKKDINKLTEDTYTD